MLCVAGPAVQFRHPSQRRNPARASIPKYAVLCTGRVGTHYPRMGAARLPQVAAAGTIRKQAAKRKNL